MLFDAMRCDSIDMIAPKINNKKMFVYIRMVVDCRYAIVLGLCWKCRHLLAVYFTYRKKKWQRQMLTLISDLVRRSILRNKRWNSLNILCRPQPLFIRFALKKQDVIMKPPGRHMLKKKWFSFYLSCDLISGENDTLSCLEVTPHFHYSS